MSVKLVTDKDKELTEAEKDEVLRAVVKLLLEASPKDHESWMSGFGAGFKYGMEQSAASTTQIFAKIRDKLAKGDSIE